MTLEASTYNSVGYIERTGIGDDDGVITIRRHAEFS